MASISKSASYMILTCCFRTKIGIALFFECVRENTIKQIRKRCRRIYPGSIPRNPVIAKLFRNAKLADNAGYGFDKMLKWEKSTNTKVYFENSIDIALVVFRFLGTAENQQKLTENQRRIVKILRNKL